VEEVMGVIKRGVLIGGLLLTAGSALAADTLVVRRGEGKFEPGLAASWSASGTKVVFELSAGVDGQAWVTTLTERMAGVSATLHGKKLEVSGLPEADLLERLAGISLSGGDVDPLAELAGLGGGVAADAPEGGGSIRASKPTELMSSAHSIKDHDPKERFEAEVVAVKQEAFPNVVLTLKMRRPGRASPLRKKLYWGKVIEAPVVYNVGSVGVDLSDEQNRQNLVAWYLEKGDRIKVHPIAVGDAFQVDWLARD
jgi:hypothetical protein